MFLKKPQNFTEIIDLPTTARVRNRCQGWPSLAEGNRCVLSPSQCILCVPPLWPLWLIISSHRIRRISQKSLPQPLSGFVTAARVVQVVSLLYFVLSPYPLFSIHAPPQSHPKAYSKQLIFQSPTAVDTLPLPKVSAVFSPMPKAFPPLCLCAPVVKPKLIVVTNHKKNAPKFLPERFILSFI